MERFREFLKIVFRFSKMGKLDPCKIGADVNDDCHKTWYTYGKKKKDLRSIQNLVQDRKCCLNGEVVFLLTIMTAFVYIICKCTMLDTLISRDFVAIHSISMPLKEKIFIELVFMYMKIKYILKFTQLNIFRSYT